VYTLRGPLSLELLYKPVWLSMLCPTPLLASPYPKLSPTVYGSCHPPLLTSPPPPPPPMPSHSPPSGTSAFVSLTATDTESPPSPPPPHGVGCRHRRPYFFSAKLSLKLTKKSDMTCS